MKRYLISLIALVCVAAALTQPEGDPATPRWIWSVEGTSNNQELTFHKAFELASVPKTASIVATCDNSMTLAVNGSIIFEHGEWTQAAKAGVRSHLREGRNEIRIAAMNEGGPAGLVGAMDMAWEGGKTRRIVTDSTWKVTVGIADDWATIEHDHATMEDAFEVGILGGSGTWGSVNARTFAEAGTGKKPATATPASEVTVPDGFEVELLYSVPRQQGSWVSCTFDDQGRLIASDQYGGLYRVTPATLGDAEGETVVEPLGIDLGAAQGLLYAFDSLYVVVAGGSGHAPGVYRLRDTTGDDLWDDIRLLKELSSGGEHGPHAIVMAPDKKSLFVVAGNHVPLPDGITKSRVPMNWGEDILLSREWDPNGHAVGRKAPAGWICRIDPDGIEWELWAIGFRNQYDIAFDRRGEMFTFDSDMEWDHGLPWYRPTRVCHVVSGADFGWRSGSGKWPSYYPDSVPAVVDIGLSSPTGVVFGYDTSFPAPYREAFFVQDWAYGKMYAVHMRTAGASYQGTFETFVSGKPLPMTDVAVGPDGAMYFTIGGRRTQSGLYRVSWTGETNGRRPAIARRPGDNAFAKRRQMEMFHGREKLDFIDEAWDRLNHPDRSVRYASRIMLEHQPLDAWIDLVASEERTQATIETIIALARQGSTDEHRQLAYSRWNSLSLDALSDTQRLEAARALALILIRLGDPTDSERSTIVEELRPWFPGADRSLNREVSALLIRLGDHDVIDPILDLMENSTTQEEQVYYGFIVRDADLAWSNMQRERLFRWIARARSGLAGGNSFQKYVDIIEADALELVADEDLRDRYMELAFESVGDDSNTTTLIARGYVKNWQMDDFADVLDEVNHGRSFERGKAAFSATMCFQCHRFAGEGGSSGPDLTGASGRFNATDLLTAIIDPSQQISDQYADTEIRTREGRLHSGLVVEETNTTVSMRPNPLSEDTIEISRSSIVRRSTSAVSRMPSGLMAILERDEVLDLLAFVLSGGDPEDPRFDEE